MSSVHFPPLNLPPTEPRIEPVGGILSIFDPIRRRFVALTPEEWVRQHFVSWLVTDLGYPRSLIANEIGLSVNGRPRRADTVVYTPDLRPLMVVEYKNADIPLTQTVFDQIVRYNIVFRAPYIAVSNGMTHYICRIDPATRTYCFLRDFPSWTALDKNF
ncbi:MAG: type I restriction enzyme HsdR N-terminal domain-containing protein [Clostridium sp.]|nr:type I restriction enzyme HsdR N-terminal domain-containing protein [Clostridium sp.]